jgi:hypothetical protein
LRQDSTVIGLIAIAHGSSHFFQLLLPPLFPLLKAEFDVSYAQLGVLMMVFYHDLRRAPDAGRIRRRPLWRAPRAVVRCRSDGAVGAAHGDRARLLGARCVCGAGGLGNSVFHPSDFTILNSRVDPKRLGHAFSVHGISGSLAGPRRR